MEGKLQIEFLSAGMYTTIQDLGRPGYQSFGVPLGGALDRRSAKLANQLLDLPLDNPVLEITLLGPKMRFSSGCQIAITGGNLSPKLNQQSIQNFQTIEVSSGDVLSFGKAISGCRAYMGIRGNWEVKKWLGSVSYFSGETTPDSLIQKNRVLEVNKLPVGLFIEWEESEITLSDRSIQLMPGPEWDYFDARQRAILVENPIRIDSSSNRMGYRLQTSILGVGKNDITSSGIVPGTIQVSNSGQPIILLADAQTTGGYARIAVVSSKDLDFLGQCKPGDYVKFHF